MSFVLTKRQTEILELINFHSAFIEELNGYFSIATPLKPEYWKIKFNHRRFKLSGKVLNWIKVRKSTFVPLIDAELVENSYSRNYKITDSGKRFLKSNLDKRELA